jgi:cobalt/nickel transport system ATP-binding protein
MSHHIVDIKDVTFRYSDGTDALREVSFRITHGEAVGLVGANGAGKSTLLLHLNGTLLPSRGIIRIGEIDVTKRTRQEIRKRVGLVFQDPDDQLFMPTVYDDVAFGPLNLGMTNQVVTDRVNAALSTVGCAHLKDKHPHHLSAGQKKAVAIAAVLVMEPDILVMDEPSSGLDPKSRRYLIRLLQGFEHTKIIASHDLDLILEVCERCLVINDGRIVADGSTDHILTDPALLEENNLELPLSAQGPGIRSRRSAQSAH